MRHLSDSNFLMIENKLTPTKIFPITILELIVYYKFLCTTIVKYLQLCRAYFGVGFGYVNMYLNFEYLQELWSIVEVRMTEKNLCEIGLI